MEPEMITCPLPGCLNLVADPREPCPDCLAAFGGMLQPSAAEITAEQAAAEYAERDAYVAAAYAAQRAMTEREAA